jgi:two-component system KDP operon response regulator KdpE
MTVPAPKILVVDDEAQIRRLLEATLVHAGYRVVAAATGREALSLLDIDKPDLVLLDLGLPDRDGLGLLPLIHAAGQARVIVVSARDAVDEKIAALDLGADDYVTKPFDTAELLARIRAALRHKLAGEAERRLVEAGDISIDLLDRRVLRCGEIVHLTPKEYGVLAELARHPGRVITHRQLLQTIWGPAQVDHVEYLRIAVRGLRQKIEADPAQPRLVINEPGVGYRLQTATDPATKA